MTSNTSNMLPTNVTIAAEDFTIALRYARLKSAYPEQTASFYEDLLC
jgi:hypothetical protein